MNFEDAAIAGLGLPVVDAPSPSAPRRTRGQDDGPLLPRISDPSVLRRLPEAALPRVSEEIRRYLIETISRSGGHLSSSLGTVELAVALHYVFDTPHDPIVWDVGHQSYPHKVLTGRREQLPGIRRRGGPSGFLRRTESPFDAFGAGHSSTSISAALGMAMAAAVTGADRRAVAVIGDGALTAGIAYEALNHAGGIQADLLVVLNDNGMSISENVGALATALARTAGRDPQRPTNAGAIPGRTDGVVATFFAALGFSCSEPVDGHDVRGLVRRLREERRRRGPRVLHVVTRKGYGYAPAERDPIKYHGVAPFDPGVGIQAPAAKPPRTYTEVFGEWLCEAAASDPRIAAVTPAMREGSGLVEFSRRFPDRYFDAGIAEQHAVTFAAGLACEGMKPVVAIYSTFLQRAYDQLVHDVALQNLPVVFAIDRAGLVGPDGATHNGNLDLTYLRCVPGLTVMTPSDGAELRDMLATAIAHPGPVAVRYPRTAIPGPVPPRAPRELPVGVARARRKGSGIALLAFGSPLHVALEAGERLDATVIDMRFVVPLDAAAVLAAGREHEMLVTLEENVVAGGAGAAVSECLASHGVATPVLHLGLPVAALEHGTRDEVLRDSGLHLEGVITAIAARRRTLAAR